MWQLFFGIQQDKRSIFVVDFFSIRFLLQQGVIYMNTQKNFRIFRYFRFFQIFRFLDVPVFPDFPVFQDFPLFQNLDQYFISDGDFDW